MSKDIDSTNASNSFQLDGWNLKFLLLFIFALSIGMVIGGALWTAFIFENLQMCGIDEQSSYFRTYTSGESRFLIGNQCPGYDWTPQLSPYKAGVYNYNFSVPSSPINCTTPIYVDNESTPLYNHIGFTISGVPIYGPLDAEDQDAVTNEGYTFDECGGHVAPEGGPTGIIAIDSAFPWNKQGDNGADFPTGEYHYHQMPGDENPRGHDEDMNLNYTLCEGVRQWYNESNNTHSPILGFMMDGYAIYGPKGANGELPQGLDECGGHSYDLGYYHYHTKSAWPFTVACLWGRVNASRFGISPTAYESKLKAEEHQNCTISDVQWSYDQLANYTQSYGEGEGNGYDDVGCLSVLVVGCVLFLYSAIHLTYVVVSEWRSDNETAAKYEPLTQEEDSEGRVHG